ncbi:uncharacterized protein LOC126583374 [Malus sylvestris]|uniref:uncharacterized protein LOC126583374 n=1 Tax=Malus sylvestris TaxID=3752 RepID=UPI0021AC6F67|nr:uncharacterized protein LOC126583374 [Malus sylvestris]
MFFPFTEMFILWGNICFVDAPCVCWCLRRKQSRGKSLQRSKTRLKARLLPCWEGDDYTVDPKLEIASKLSKMNLSIEDQIKALNILFKKPQNERTLLSLDGAMKKAFVLMLLGQSNRN